MNFNHLHYFYIVVREGSVSAASRFLNVSQPSLSSQIKTFEESLGAPLFERKGNKLELTSQGKAVYENAAQMFEISASIPEIVNKEPRNNLVIKIGIADELERPFAVNLAKSLFSKWETKELPSIRFTTDPNDVLLGKLRSWAVDAAITNRPSSFEDLEISGTLVMPVFLAVGAGTFSKDAVSYPTKDISKLLQDLGKGLSVPTPRIKLREEIDQFLSKGRRGYPIIFESDTLATVIRAIVDNVGVGFVPLPYILRELIKHEVAICGPPDGIWKHTLFLMTKKGRTLSSGIVEVSRAFEDIKQEIARISSKIRFARPRAL